jgi:hypothetical protein
MIRSLVDTGSNQNIMSQRLYQKLLRSTACTQGIDAQTRETDITLLSDNASEMPIIATIDTDIKINGIKIPVTFRVIPDLVHDIILVEQFLQQTEAITDVGTNTFSLYRGFMSVPMIKTILRQLRHVQPLQYLHFRRHCFKLAQHRQENQAIT